MPSNAYSKRRRKEREEQEEKVEEQEEETMVCLNPMSSFSSSGWLHWVTPTAAQTLDEISSWLIHPFIMLECSNISESLLC
ncbi:hypothetical protein ACLKA6_005996 [Drosophila palustris]